MECVQVPSAGASDFLLDFLGIFLALDFGGIVGDGKNEWPRAPMSLCEESDSKNRLHMS